MHVRITDAFAIAGRGISLTFETDAAVDLVLEINAAQRLIQPFPPPRRLTLRRLVGEVSTRPPLFPRRSGMQVIRSRAEFSAFIPLTSPVAIEVVLEAVDGSRATDTVTA